MILDLNAVKRSGKSQESFFFEYNADIAVAIPDVNLLSPVKINGELFLTGENAAEIEGEITFTLSGACTRCLADTEKTFVVEFNESCGTEDGYPVVNGKIDLSKIADDLIILNTPVAFLCREDCKGLCPTCGANLNDGECKCNNK
ncbi:MAG: DUF177 domain-containing protein [Clostridia bacterium]|nr:DUF177 domain-containing protein [Clostridia bacterium]